MDFKHSITTLDYETLDSIRLTTGLEPLAHIALEAEVADFTV